jgi:hypothetical protein
VCLKPLQPIAPLSRALVMRSSMRTRRARLERHKIQARQQSHARATLADLPMHEHRGLTMADQRTALDQLAHQRGARIKRRSQSTRRTARDGLPLRLAQVVESWRRELADPCRGWANGLEWTDAKHGFWPLQGSLGPA